MCFHFSPNICCNTARTFTRQLGKLSVSPFTAAGYALDCTLYGFVSQYIRRGEGHEFKTPLLLKCLPSSSAFSAERCYTHTPAPSDITGRRQLHSGTLTEFQIAYLHEYTSVHFNFLTASSSLCFFECVPSARSAYESQMAWTKRTLQH